MYLEFTVGNAGVKISLGGRPRLHSAYWNMGVRLMSGLLSDWTTIAKNLRGFKGCHRPLPRVSTRRCHKHTTRISRLRFDEPLRTYFSVKSHCSPINSARVSERVSTLMCEEGVKYTMLSADAQLPAFPLIRRN